MRALLPFGVVGNHHEIVAFGRFGEVGRERQPTEGLVGLSAGGAGNLGLVGRDETLKALLRGGESLVSVRLGTGRSHQIRVQFASRGMPLLGDVKYGSARRDCRIALWSRRLCFAHPLTGQSVDMSVSPPESAPWTDFMYFKKETDNG